MVTQADFLTYKPIKIGVSAEPPAIIIKYIDGKSKNVKHHLVSLKKIKELKDVRILKDYIMRGHGKYFEEDKVPAKKLEKIIEKFIEKRNVWREEILRKGFEKKENGFEKAQKNRKEEIEQSPDVKKNISKPSLNPSGAVDESEGYFDDEDMLRSSDLGMGKRAGSQSKLSQEGLPSIFKNQSMSKSRLTNLADSMKDKGKEPQAIVNKEPTKVEREKFFGQTKNTAGESTRKEKTVIKDDFTDEFDDDFDDDFGLDKSKKSASVKKFNSNTTPQSKKDDKSKFISSRPVATKDEGFDDNEFDDFDDDFEDVEASKPQKSKKSKSRSSLGGFDDFDDIPDEEDEENALASQSNNLKSNRDQKQSKLTELNFDYKTTKLNKLTDEEIELVKKKMDIDFKQLKPGDPGFVYEKSASFQQEESNDWDS